MTLSDFLRADFVLAAGAYTKLSEIHRGYRDTLPAPDRAKWTRARTAIELAALGHVIAVRNSATYVVGLASTRPVVVEDGRLVA